MLLTPHIVRTHELTAEDLAPIYIGTQQNIGLAGPPPLIAPPPDDPAAASRPGCRRRPAVPRRASRRRAAVHRLRPRPGVPTGTQPVPPGTSPVPCADRAGDGERADRSRRRRQARTPAARRPIQRAPPRDPNAPVPATPRRGDCRPTTAQIIVTPPGTEFRVAGGPSTVPVSVNNASRLSTMTLTVTYNPQVLRVRNVQEGTFMRQGGVTATFTPRIDAAAGRVDIAVARTGDQAGASGAGLLAALLFDAVGPGNSLIQVSGVASTPEGVPIQLQFNPASVTVR